MGPPICKSTNISCIFTDHTEWNRL